MNSNRLKEIRTERGMPITELARRTGLNRLTLSNIERGLSDPSLSTMAKICIALDKNPNEIFFDSFVNHEERKGV